MDFWFILIFTGLIVIVAIFSCHIATYFGVGCTGIFQNYIKKYIDAMLKEKIELLEKEYFSHRTEGIQTNGVVEKFAVHYSNNYEIKDAWDEFKEYVIWDCNRLDGIKSKLEALSAMRKMKITSGGTELWFNDRRPGLTKISR